MIWYLREYDSSAHDCSKDPSVGDILEDGDRSTDDEDKNVCEGEVDKEQVNNSLQVTTGGDRENNLEIRNKWLEERTEKFWVFSGSTEKRLK